MCDENCFARKSTRSTWYKPMLFPLSPDRKRKEMRIESGDQLDFFVISYHHVVGVHDEINSPSAELP